MQRVSTELLWVPVRFVPLLAGAAYLGIQSSYNPRGLGVTDWVLIVVSGGLVLAGGRFPLAVLIGQSLLFAAGPLLFSPGWAVVVVLGPVALAELWMRRSGWQCWVGTGVFLFAQAVVLWRYSDALFSTTSMALMTLPALLLGLYIRRVLQRAVTAQRQREEALRDARAAERTAIARELHDLIAHYLGSIALQVGAARHALGENEPEVAVALAEVHATARTGLADLRRLVATLRDPDTLDDQVGAAMAEPKGLPAALAAAVERARGAGLTVEAEIDPGVTTVDAMRRLAVLRVVQEGLTNVIKHAGPDARATLRVDAVRGEVQILISDDRRGRPAEARGGGFGLIGMRERIELLGGTVRAGASPRGWVLAVEIPGGPA
ncbi:sensor histidine kinase [Kutzneria sp. CA-103260]|uniref:sensor histidine kinase n=1 Tax=Kutzneria sp. CA-103260 TaxID=2802641 RepID=UPI001BAE0B01|nr:sensor histidine kinase [Kutzneria sp. CA-103260]